VFTTETEKSKREVDILMIPIIEHFAKIMNKKMLSKNAERGNSYERCSKAFLINGLLEHVLKYQHSLRKEDLPDIAIYCAMLYGKLEPENVERLF